MAVAGFWGLAAEAASSRVVDGEPGGGASTFPDPVVIVLLAGENADLPGL